MMVTLNNECTWAIGAFITLIHAQLETWYIRMLLPRHLGPYASDYTYAILISFY